MQSAATPFSLISAKKVKNNEFACHLKKKCIFAKKIRSMKTHTSFSPKVISLLLIIVFDMIGNQATAQLPFNFKYAEGISFENSIVRRYNDTKAIVYYEEGGFGYVSLVDLINDQGYRIKLDTGIFMNDMCILKDSVFLCGRNVIPNRKTGCIVAIDINELISGTATPRYFEPSYWIHCNLKRIKGYEYTIPGIERKYAKFLLVGDIYFACDSTEPFPRVFSLLSINDGNDYTYSTASADGRCVVNSVWEVSYPFSYGSPSAATTNQIVLRAVNPDIHPEIIHDVVVTENYVAFIGLEGISSKAITLHICNKDDNVLRNFNLSVQSDFDDYYSYPLSSNNANPFYHACALNGDRIAIVADSEDPTSPDQLYIRAIDLNTQTMFASQVFLCSEKPHVIDVALGPDGDSILVLYNDKYLPNNVFRDMVCKVDASSTQTYYYQPCIVDKMPPIPLNSIDAMPKSFITTGRKFGMVCKTSIMGNADKCHEGVDYLLKKSTTIDPSTSFFRYDQFMPTSTSWEKVAVPEHINYKIICME